MGLKEGKWPHLNLLFITFSLTSISSPPTRNIKVLPTINLWKALHEGNLNMLRRGLEMYKKKEYQPEEEYYFQSFFCTKENVFWTTTPLTFSTTKELVDFFLDEVKVSVNQRVEKKMEEYSKGLYLNYGTPVTTFYQKDYLTVIAKFSKDELLSDLASRGAKFDDDMIQHCLMMVNDNTGRCN
jgi:hypothetical protein